MEVKTLPQFTKEIEGRTVTGIFAVHGNIDDGGDRSWPGAFLDTAIDGRNRARYLWQHNSFEPPIAAIKSIREVTREDLPPAVLSFAPNATGGAEVVREYLDTPRGNEVFAGIKAGAIDEMSYGYDVTQSDHEEIDGCPIRNLRKVRLYDVSDVNWGMNPATVGSKAWSGADLEFVPHSEAVVSAVEEFLGRAKSRQDFRAKEGRVLSEANRKRIAALVESLSAVQQELDELLKATEPKADPAIVRQLLAESLYLQTQLIGA
jgi:HK97 family phage prohead protease